MKTQKFKKKKSSIGKGKIKKTIKNVICRPDPIFWPVINEDEEISLYADLEKLRVPIPDFKKPHWNDLKLMPRKERPQPPQIQKVGGLLFGLSTCCQSVKAQKCSAVLLDANINPQAIVQPTIEACTLGNISVLCLNKLRQYSLAYFGIKTSCLGIQINCLQELNNKINQIHKNKQKVKTTYKMSTMVPQMGMSCSENGSLVDNVKKEHLQMDVDSYCPYVYRTDKKTRTFVPPDNLQDIKYTNQFTGQNFVKLSEETKASNNSKGYMRMILKKISNNPNRIKGRDKS